MNWKWFRWTLALFGLVGAGVVIEGVTPKTVLDCNIMATIILFIVWVLSFFASSDRTDEENSARRRQIVSAFLASLVFVVTTGTAYAVFW